MTLDPIKTDYVQDNGLWQEQQVNAIVPVAQLDRRMGADRAQLASTD